MGLTNKLGQLSQSIQQDASNNIGIGGTVNASYKLTVTGTTLITGAATFSSSITANTFKGTYAGLGDWNSFGNQVFIQPNGANNSHISDNMYYNGGWLFANAGAGAQIYFGASAAGSIDFRTAPTGAAGGTPSITNRMTILQGGNVGIGTSSPDRRLTIGGTTNAYMNFNPTSYRNYVIGSDDLGFILYDNFNSAYRMVVNSSGNVGIGTSSPYALLSVYSGSAGDRILIDSNAASGSNGAIAWGAGSLPNISARIRGIDDGGYGTHLLFETRGNGVSGTTTTERMRITSSGKVLVGTSSVISGNYAVQASALGGFVTNASNSGDASYYSVTGTVGWHFYAEGGGSTRMYVLQNGDVRNANNSYGAISDISLKENITDATPKLQDLLKVKVRNYNFIADETKTKQIGVIAQELEEVFPNMISEDKQMGSEETIKTVKYSVFVPMLIKAIQELSAKVTALENK